MTRAQLREIANLCLELGKSWDVEDEQAMLEAIPDGPAENMIRELRGRLAEIEEMKDEEQ